MGTPGHSEGRAGHVGPSAQGAGGLGTVGRPGGQGLSLVLPPCRREQLLPPSRPLGCGLCPRETQQPLLTGSGHRRAHAPSPQAGTPRGRPRPARAGSQIPEHCTRPPNLLCGIGNSGRGPWGGSGAAVPVTCGCCGIWETRSPGDRGEDRLTCSRVLRPIRALPGPPCARVCLFYGTDRSGGGWKGGDREKMGQSSR